MEVILKRGVKDGERFIEVWIDGKKIGGEHGSISYGYSLRTISQILTSAWSPNGGIFAKSKAVFRKGNYEKEFEFNGELDIWNDEIEYIAEEIQNRVKLVRTWTETLDYTMEMKINLPYKPYYKSLAKDPEEEEVKNEKEN